MSRYCTNCGQPVPDNVNFCENCGARLSRPNSSPQPNTQQTYQPQNYPPQGYAQQGYQQYPQQRQQDYPQQGMQPGPYTQKKRSAGGTIVKLVIAAAILCVIWFVGKPFLEREGILPSSGSGSPSSGQSSTGRSSGRSGSSGSSGGSSGSSDPGGPGGSQGLLSPDGDPWFDDFLFYENDVYYNGIPSGAYLEGAGYAAGQWKYCLTFNRTIEGEERIDEIGLAEISFSGDTATLILHPQYIRYSSDVYPEDESEIGYPAFTGTWGNEEIEVSGGGIAISLGTFYGYNGSEYVLGSIIAQNTGMFGDVLLVRP